MCSPYDAVPPSPPEAGPLQAGEPVTLTAEDGNQLLAWYAAAAQPSGAGVVILPDIRGLFPFYQRLAEQFASVGIDAVAIDYFGRTAGTGPRGEDFDHMTHIKQTTFEGVSADLAAGAAHLRAQGNARAIFPVGFCFGGSYAYLHAARGTAMGLAGVIGFYGGMWARSEGGPTAIEEAPRAQVPVLGLFGGADKSIPADKIEEFTAGLVASGVAHEVKVYPGAPHSFFDRSFADHQSECADAWQRMLSFMRANTMQS